MGKKQEFRLLEKFKFTLISIRWLKSVQDKCLKTKNRPKIHSLSKMQWNLYKIKQLIFLPLPSNKTSHVFLFFPVRISAEDLSKLFDIVELCSVSPDTLVEGNKPVSPVSPASPLTWTISEHEGRWVSGSSAGGSRKYRSTFVTMNYGFELFLRLI